MIARLSQALLLLELIAVVLIAWAAKQWGYIDSWTLALPCGVIAVLLCRLSITTNNFFIAWQYRSETPTTHRLSWSQACRLFLGECYATLWSTSWVMPFKTFYKRDVAHSSDLPVLLIHGYGCNSGYWHTLSKVLMQENISHHAISLEPVLADIDSYIPAIHDAIEILCKASGHAHIIIVAHSMGGLAARAYLRNHGGDQADQRVAQLITLGTPHHGTGIANFGVGISSQQMQWHGNAQDGTPSIWLRKLDQCEDLALRARIVSIYSHHDNIVAPQTSAHLEGARNIAYQGIGHVALALHPLIHARVLAEIRHASVREKDSDYKEIVC